ncbi:MAG: TIR domain-containing protein [Actinobacteria bacterium]|nr:TIR domain-containing protein [Actinomycetota bacterium]
MRVFFCHKSHEKPLLRELRGYLPPWLTTWVDEDQLLIGSVLNTSLRTAIDEDVDFVVLFLSRDAAESPWVQQEIQWALAREEVLGRVFLLPVLLGDVRDSLEALDLGGRLTIELSDHTQTGIRLLAEKLTNHIGGWLSEVLRLNQTGVLASPRSGSDLDESVSEALRTVPPTWRSIVDEILTRPFLQHLHSSRIGQIPLTPSQYYQRILSEVGRADSVTEIVAVSMLTSILWSGDADQNAYAARNMAAVQRGARVRRLFVIPAGAEPDFRSTIESQTACGIEVRVGTYNLFAHVPDLEDFVLFKDADGSRAFIALPTVDGSRRIRSGLLDLSTHGTTQLSGAFNEAWDIATPAETILRRSIAPLAKKVAGSKRPPGDSLAVHRLTKEVISCEEAAAARGIPLVNELKTLILRTHDGLVAAHLPGDGVLSLRKVKDRLETAEAYLADPEDLLAIGLSAGTVSAVLDPVWSLPHLVSRRLLDLRQVMTNNGTRTGYFAFDPALLVEAPDVVVADIEK